MKRMESGMDGLAGVRGRSFVSLSRLAPPGHLPRRAGLTRCPGTGTRIPLSTISKRSGMRRPPVRKLRRALVAAGLLAVAAALRAPAGAQQAPPVRFLAPVGLAEPAPVDAPPLDAEAARLQAAALPIALPVALRLSVANNLDVARARETSVQAGI